MRSVKGLGSLRLRVVVLGLAVALLSSAPGIAANPGEEVKSLINEVLGILNNPALQGDSHRAQRVAQVEKATARRFDYREMAKRTLADTWEKLNPKQRDEFVHLFSELLKASYACRLDEVTKTTVAYQPEVIKADISEVPTVFQRPNDKIPVTFRLLQKPQGWMIYDVVIDQVSMVDNFHSQFSRLIQGGSYQDLVRCLRTKMQEECKPTQ